MHVNACISAWFDQSVSSVTISAYFEFWKLFTRRDNPSCADSKTFVLNFVNIFAKFTAFYGLQD